MSKVVNILVWISVCCMSFFDFYINAQSNPLDTTSIQYRLVYTNNFFSNDVMTARFIQTFRKLYGDSLYFKSLSKIHHRMYISLYFSEQGKLKGCETHSYPTESDSIFQFVDKNKWKIFDEMLKTYGYEIFVMACVFQSGPKSIATTIGFPYYLSYNFKKKYLENLRLYIDIFCRRYENPPKEEMEKFMRKDLSNMDEWYHSTF